MGAEGTTPSVCDTSHNISSGCSCAWIDPLISLLWELFLAPVLEKFYLHWICPSQPLGKVTTTREFKIPGVQRVHRKQEFKQIRNIFFSFQSHFSVVHWQLSATPCSFGKLLLYPACKDLHFSLRLESPPNPFFKSWEVPKLHLGGSRAMAGIDLACPSCLGFHGKELYSFYCQITKFHKNWKQHLQTQGRRSQPSLTAPVKPSLSVPRPEWQQCRSSFLLQRQQPRAGNVELTLNPSAQVGKASIWQEQPLPQLNTGLKPDSSAQRDMKGDFSPLPIKLPLSKRLLFV